MLAVIVVVNIEEAHMKTLLIIIILGLSFQHFISPSLSTSGAASIEAAQAANQDAKFDRIERAIRGD